MSVIHCLVVSSWNPISEHFQRKSEGRDIEKPSGTHANFDHFPRHISDNRWLEHVRLTSRKRTATLWTTLPFFPFPSIDNLNLNLHAFHSLQDQKINYNSPSKFACTVAARISCWGKIRFQVPTQCIELSAHPTPRHLPKKMSRASPRPASLWRWPDFVYHLVFKRTLIVGES